MTTTTPPWAARVGSLVGSVIDSSTSLLQRQAHDVVSFAMGSPAAEAVPVEILGELADKVGTEAGAATYDYAATEGDPRLLTAILDHLDGTQEATDADRLLVTSGAMQGLDLAGKLFLDPGDLVAVEAPTYTNGTATVLSYQAEVVEIPVDADGMMVEALPDLVERAGRLPKALYVIPNFQNPSGTTLSLARREMLLDLARGWNSLIIDDDPYGLLRFSGDDVPSLRALSGGDPLVFSIRTFSKTLAPGLRVGYVDADPRVIPHLVAAKQAMDTCTNLPAQLLIAEFLAGGHMGPHLGRLKSEYQLRKRAMQEALTEFMPPGSRWTDPDGGLFLWLTLPDEIDTTELFAPALANGVAYIPGSAFSPSGRFSNALRLCFASTTPERTREGIRRLGETISRVAQP